MCGICAIVSLNAGERDETLNSMLRTLSHRGPDAQGVVVLPGCALGHRRLSIIDLDTGRQPMSFAGGRYHITYNGEIYNFRELRRELEKLGHCFRTTSDTEVILVAFDAWGSNCLDRFRGMFAFAIWDAHERRLFCARDLFGEKPLYYATAHDGTFVVSSEIKGLLASGIIEAQLDLTAVDAYLAFGYIPPDRTVYANVHTLPGGHCLTWHDGRIDIVRYWQPCFEKRSIDLVEASAHLRTLIESAVERQMVSDVPVGAFLSGGLDSSTIVALMQRQSSQPVKTFSVGFGQWINELPYARTVAERYGTDHYEVDFGTPAVAELLLRMAEVYDEPFADTSNIPTFLLSEFARQQVKVVLTGDGGDELFGGYAWYQPLSVAERMNGSYPTWIALRIMSKLLRDRMAGIRTMSLAAGLSARWPDAWSRCMMSNMQFKEQERNSLWGGRAKEVVRYLPGEAFHPAGNVNGIDRGFHFDLTAYLPGDILVKVDRAAMANSLETRAPFLDRDVAEFALSLPSALKVTGEETKIVLRHACSDLWPKELGGLKKQGFGSPVNVWLALPEVKNVTDRVFADGSHLRQLLPGVTAHHGQGRDYKAWMLLTLGLWLEKRGIGA